VRCHPSGGVGVGGDPVVVKSLRSKVEFVVRQSPTSKDVNTVAEDATALEFITRHGEDTAD
jgi:hypothetical protein